VTANHLLSVFRLFEDKKRSEWIFFHCMVVVSLHCKDFYMQTPI